MLTQVQFEFREVDEALNAKERGCDGVEEGTVVLEGPAETVYQVQKEIVNIIMALVSLDEANYF